jgi:predicted SprT family Zn-dependent metalloprotease
MHDADLQAYAQRLLQELCKTHPLPQTPKIVWKRYRVTAGMAFYRTGSIGLSSIVLKSPEMVRTTLLHEYAHLLAVARYGPKAAGHGPVWRQAMTDLGLVPEVRHTYPVVRNTPRQRVTYRCVRCAKEIHRSRRLPRKQRYVHAECGGDLRLAKVQRITAGPADA